MRGEGPGILGHDVDLVHTLGLVVRYTAGALVLIGAVVALQRADRALSPGARGAATGAALLGLLALAEVRRRAARRDEQAPRAVTLPPAPRVTLPSIHLVEITYPWPRCARCGAKIVKEREDDRMVMVAEPGRLRYYHRGCAPWERRTPT